MSYKIENELNTLDAKRICIWKDEFNRLRLKIAEKPLFSIDDPEAKSYLEKGEIPESLCQHFESNGIKLPEKATVKADEKEKCRWLIVCDDTEKSDKTYSVKKHRDKLEVSEAEVEYPEVKIVMSFPLSNNEQFVSVFEMKDGRKEKEIGMIEDIGKLDSKSKKLLKEELRKEYFMPRIVKINSMKEVHGIMKFNVETESGSRQFETRYKEDIRRLPDGRIVIKDADGNRYEIRDPSKLDPRSVNLIDTEI